MSVGWFVIRDWGRLQAAVGVSDDLSQPSSGRESWTVIEPATSSETAGRRQGWRDTEATGKNLPSRELTRPRVNSLSVGPTLACCLSSKGCPGSRSSVAREHVQLKVTTGGMRRLASVCAGTCLLVLGMPRSRTPWDENAVDTVRRYPHGTDEVGRSAAEVMMKVQAYTRQTIERWSTVARDLCKLEG